MKKQGLLLLNLGSPDAPTRAAVARYLKEFLMDPYVITLPTPLRWLLVKGIIVPFRAKTSARYYQSIWQPEGAPLKIISQAITDSAQAHLGEHWQVALGMRYGQPSTEAACQSLIAGGCDSIVVLPLYPQYAQSSTQTAIDEALKYLKPHYAANDVHVIQDYYAHPAYINALATETAAATRDLDVEHIVLSYHGVPHAHLDKVEAKPCDRQGPCPVITDNNRRCYRAQCYATSRALAQALSWGADDYTVAFQSRLGRQTWTGPYLEQALADLYDKGIRRIAVATPSFVADCLETLEEINIRARETWIETLGGEAFHTIPCLNTAPSWIEAISTLVREIR